MDDAPDFSIFKKEDRQKVQLKEILPLLKPETKNLTIALGAMMGSTAVALVFPTAMGQIVDLVTQPDAADKLKSIGFFLAGIFAGGSVLSFLKVSLLNISSERITANLRRQLFDSIIAQEVGFFDKTRTGELLNRLVSDIKIISDSLTDNLSYGLRSVMSLIGGLYFLFHISPQLTLVSLALMPALGIGATVYGRVVKKYTKQVQESLAKANEIADEKLSNIRTVRMFNSEVRESGRYSEAIQKAFELAKRAAVLEGSWSAAVGFGGYMSLLAVLWYGGSLVISQALTMGDLMSFAMYSLTVGMSSSGLTSVYSKLMRGLGASERVFEIIRRQPLIPPSTTSTTATTASSSTAQQQQRAARIEFRDVCFEYPTRTDVPVLKNLSLVIEPGQVVAVVGPSGSGKSTLTALLERFYDASSGTILLDGEDIRTVAPSDLRRQIGMVGQEPVLFAGTIFENIAYGMPGATLEQVEHAARAANAHSFVSSFPDGYNTLVGERGITLSGGQKQRIALARAVLLDPRILILDEATSALDAESELLVQEALQRLMKGRSCLIIAHRLSTIKHADQIAVVANGAVIEKGTYDELVAKPEGAFRQLVSKQFQQQ